MWRGEESPSPVENSFDERRTRVAAIHVHPFVAAYFGASAFNSALKD
jgi:hypothetical protein